MARRSQGLSERHRKIMEFLIKFQNTNGYSPSIRQIGDSINVKSTSLVDYYLNQLQQMGFIDREDRISRSIRVLTPVIDSPSLKEKVADAVQNVSATLSDLVSIPLAGRIVASAPIPMPTSDLPYFDSESSVDIARSLLPARETNDLFALEVSGDSMVDAMINDGDIVIMKQVKSANNGEMVAVWLDDRDETTLKYFYKEANRIRLQPANPNMGPIYVDNPKSLRIMGRVVMVIRQVKSIAV
ncbi:MAG TPA: repressor LexA [Anaerolineaceae bacterium]|nr:repressor LexA [Anaerolineaceae bacterium]